MILRASTLLVLSSIISTIAFSEQKPEENHAEIVMSELFITASGVPGFSDNTGKTTTFSEICPQIAAYFLAESPAAGLGVFESVNCSDKIPSAAKGRWSLQIRVMPEAAQFDLFDLSGNSQKLEASVKIGVTSKLVSALQDPKVTEALALRLLTESPAIGSVSASKMSTLKSLSAKWSTMPSDLVPRDLLVYEMAKSSSGLLMSRPTANATFTQKSTGAYSWALTRRANATEINSPRIYVHDARGRGANLPALDAHLEKMWNPYATTFSELATFAYMGIRVGMPLVASDPLLKSPLIGLFFEKRYGTLSGLRLSHDRSPQVKSSTSSETRQFSWSRTQLGYAWGWPLEIPLINWVDVIPKLGFTNYDLRKTSTDKPTTNYEFTLQNAVATGLEVGVENRTFQYLVRGWALINYSVINTISAKTSINQTRIGADIYRDLFKIGKDYRFTLLGFASQEFTTLKRESTSATTSDLVSSLSYANIFAGVGLTLAW